jgi:hypothetical protein
MAKLKAKLRNTKKSKFARIDSRKAVFISIEVVNREDMCIICYKISCELINPYTIEITLRP